MKLLHFVGDSRERLSEFPEGARRKAGHELRLIQSGEEPSDWKPLAGLPSGIRELRVWDVAGTFRVVYVTKFAEALIVLHAFQKKTQATAKRDIETVRRRYDEARTMYGRQ